MADSITLLRAQPPARMTKTWLADGTVKGYDNGFWFRHKEEPVESLEDVYRVIQTYSTDPHVCVVVGRYAGPDDHVFVERDGREVTAAREIEGVKHILRRGATFEWVPHHWLKIDVDGFRPLIGDPVEEPELAVQEYIWHMLPAPFRSASYIWMLSGSAGHQKHAGVLKAHLIFWSDVARCGYEWTAWAESLGLRQSGVVDVAFWRKVQPNYIAGPMLEEGVVCPVTTRYGFSHGLIGGDLSVPFTEAMTGAAAAVRTREETSDRDSDWPDPREKPGVIGAFCRAFPTIDDLLVQEWAPNFEREPGSTRRLTWHDGGGAAGGAFLTGDGRIVVNTHNSDPLLGAPANFFDLVRAHRFGHLDDVVPEAERWTWVNNPAAMPSDRAMRAFALGLPEVQAIIDSNNQVKAKKRDLLASIPEAQYLVTDQANAQRIANHWKGQLLVAQDRWYAWSGVQWECADDGVYRRALNLSHLIRQEAEEWLARPAATDEARRTNQTVAEALSKWAKRSEMKATVEAAVGICKKLMTVADDLLDADPFLLNCANGTVDLRTGAMNPHDPMDFITHMIPTDYKPEATCPVWEQSLAEMMREEDRSPDKRPVSRYLRRLAGYCATGSVRENVLSILYGPGGNGKSVFIETLSGALNGYATAAAPGLLVGKSSDRHPTEIADLYARRLVVTSESGDGGILREDFVKQATGGDTLKGRWMRGDFFDFKPTHKLLLLTNHKPVIKGQDAGIWRRIQLVGFNVKFGTPEQVASGAAHRVKDTRLMERLAMEREGILAWLVAGAREWFTEGLEPPDVVLDASAEYRREQDRVGQFVAECCDIGHGHMSYLDAGTDTGLVGLYSVYRGWCTDAGVHPVAKKRFFEELERVAPVITKEEVKVSTFKGRKTVVQLKGIRLME